MKIAATYSRKAGMPNYGSISAGCTVEIDIKAGTEDKAKEAIIAAYSIATRAVEQHLADQIAALVPPPPDPAGGDLAEPEPAEEFRAEPSRPARTDRPDRSERTPYRGGQTGHGPAANSDHPDNGRQLLACLLRWSEAAGRDLKPEVVDYGKEQGWGWKISDWDRDQAREAALWLAERRAEERVRANGHARRNGR